MGSGNKYNIKDPALQYFISNTQIEKEIQKENLIHSFLNDMKYNINYGDGKSKRYYFIKDLNNQYVYSNAGFAREAPSVFRDQQSQLGSGFNQYIFLPSDPDEIVDELVDQLADELVELKLI